jgi:hypothetical protein
MKYAVKMGSGAAIYTASFIKIGSGNQKLMTGEYADTLTYRHTDSMEIT